MFHPRNHPRPCHVDVLACLCVAWAAASAGASANEGAAQAATDAFGTSIGRESIGLYSAERVRGFSPVDAGNVRLDGLYFDQVWELPPTLLASTRVRVGLSTLGFVFPAPTGIVDQQWRRAEATDASSMEVYLDTWGTRGVDVSLARRLDDTGQWSWTGGWSTARTAYVNGTVSMGHAGGGALWWRPGAGTEAMAFATMNRVPYDEIGTVVTAANATLPPLPSPRRFDGPSWARYEARAHNVGVTLRHDVSTAWQVRAGVFRSQADDLRGFANLLLDVDAAGRGQRVVVADPPSRYRSDSGELRLTRRWAFDDMQHRMHLQFTGRDRRHRSGGSDDIDYGSQVQGQRFEPPLPTFNFGPQTNDAVRQFGVGLAYEGRVRRALEWNAGVQRSGYRKRVDAPSVALATTAANPWLGYANLAWHSSQRVAWYAGYTKGLEESGTAPENAINRNQALPAVLTRQVDAGVRWQMREGLKLVAGFFDVRKPYTNLDSQQRFTRLGDVRHQGLEASLSGDVSSSLRVVAGVVAMDPRVSGTSAAAERVGVRPVGQAERLVKLDLVWRPSGAPERASFDLGWVHQSRVPATSDNAVWLPAFNELNLGLRVQLPTGAAEPSQLRLALTNALDARNLELRGAGAYALRRTRLLTVTWMVDW